MSAGDVAGERDDPDAHLLVPAEDALWRVAVDHDCRGLEPRHDGGEALGEAVTVVAVPERAERADRDDAAPRSAVAAEAMGPSVAPAQVADDLDPVRLEPAADGAGPVDVVELDDEGHVSVDAEVRQDDAPEPLQEVEPAHGVVPKPLEVEVVLVEVHPLVAVVTVDSLGEGYESVRNLVDGVDDGELEEPREVGDRHEEGVPDVAASLAPAVEFGHCLNNLQ